jgi:hypothetical protein
MRRFAALLTLLLAGSCAPKPAALPPAAVVSGSAVSQAPVCRVAANGGPVLADRGIGGTGIGADEARLAEQGIGGTGIGMQIPQSVVRGLTGIGAAAEKPEATKTGDAGIVGVITGFGSVCVDGAEIGLDGAVPLQIDDSTAPGTALRAGQVVVIEAAIDDGGLRSLHLAVRHEVAGPVERLGTTGGTMTIAGQAVVVPATAWGAGQFVLGDWVSVSGLPQPDGTILATRLDSAAKGMVSIRGRVVNQGGNLRIGSATLVPPPGSRVSAGMFVAVSGRYAAGVLRAGKLASDRLAQDPAEYFGSSAHRIIERSIVRIEPGRVLLGGVLPVPVAPGLILPAGDTLDAVVTLDRGSDGAYAVSRVDGMAPAAGR